MFRLYSLGDLQGEAPGSPPTAAYTYGPTGLISKRNLTGTPASFWYQYGPQGEARALTNSAGTDTYRYTAYGELLGSTGSTVNPFRYGGKFGYYTDVYSGLIIAGQRWYSPQLLRWLTRDPIHYERGVNLYEYVEGKPLRYVDPMGLDTVVIVESPNGWVGDHTGVWVDNNGDNVLYDPSGHFRNGRRGSGDAFYGEEANFQEYLDYMKSGGNEVGTYRFSTSSQEEAEIVERINRLGNGGFLGCATSVSAALRGTGPFKNLGSYFFPSHLGEKLLQLQIEIREQLNKSNK